ncbi:type II toxin-antitoxin system Phd/YefM family antitoxin [Niveispirillum sp. KHB5.9]|uniref:type II toxin-antitoxin system Phd/YefM family antitoxin n=1 Tax=Niveispirillum sp. KHB5.9 TaxID=3400269 RepID=UPI003A88814C
MPRKEERAVTAAEANRRFSHILRDVRQDGARFLVTAHGAPVARIVPTNGEDDGAAERAKAALLRRLEQQPVVVGDPWTRDELYD